MMRTIVFYRLFTLLLLAAFIANCSDTPKISSPAASYWTGTFTGINGPAVQITIPSSSSGGPFQAATVINSSSQTTTTNPFLLNQTPITQQVVQSTAQSIAQLLDNDSVPLSQKLNATLTTNTTIGGNSMKSNPKTRLRITPAANAINNLTNVSFTQVQQQLQTPIKPIFPPGSDVANAYQNFMNALQSAPGFLPIFKKIHITALHQLYMYLTGIYTSLNMTHIDDLKTYMVTEKKYCLNKKTLIINHLLQVIMAQLNQALRATMPGMPEQYAIAGGMTCIQSDKISNPNMFILDLEKSVLATLGLTKLDPSKIMATSLALKKYISLLNIEESTDLQAGVTALGSSDFSSNNLSEKEAAALVSALQKIISFLGIQQLTGQLASITALFKSPSNGNQITTEQVAQLQRLIAQCVYAAPLNDEIQLAQTFAELLGNGTGKPSATPLTTNQLKGLKGILGFILQRYEEAATTQVSQILQVFGELNPTYQVLSPSQSIKLKTLAQSMLPLPTQNNSTSSSTNTSLMLENITDTQRALLAYGLWIFSNSGQNVSTTQQQTLQSIAIPLKEQGMAYANLSPSQQQAFNLALTSFSNYQLPPLSAADFGKQAQKSLAQLNPSSTEQDREADIASALALIGSSTFTSFNQLTTEQQILLLQLFQMVDQVFETRRLRHTEQSTELKYLFTGSQAMENSLFTSISSGQYEALNAIDQLLESGRATISCATIAAVTPPSSVDSKNAKAWMAPQQALLRLFTLPVKQNPTLKKPAPLKTSYLTILLQLRKQHFQDPALEKVVNTISPSEKSILQNTLTLLSGTTFSISQLTTTAQTLLTSLLTRYKTALTTTAPIQRISSLSNPNENALQTVCNVIQATHLNIKMRGSFLWALNQYLTFFNLYAKTLQTVSSDSETPSYIGLTQFATYAQNIQKTLEYESTTDGIAQLISKTNPPLFFYDPATFRGIRLLPKLALLVEKSSTAPYPTFGIEQAICPPDQTVPDPITGVPVSNYTNLGPTFGYNKFFFLEAPSTTQLTGLTPQQQTNLELAAAKTELTGTLPSWITKITELSSKGTTTLYEPNNIPNDSITGFYLNLPTFQQDPNNSGNSLISLFEQPIIAQPDWLNRSGTGDQNSWSGVIPKNSAGAITMLRGCLGDFESVLDLNIFDPCLTIIFKKALALSADPKDATARTYSSSETARCAAYMTEKQALIKEQASTGTTSTTPTGEQITTPNVASTATIPTAQASAISSAEGTN